MKATASTLAATLALGTDFGSRTIYLVGEIDDDVAGRFLMTMDQLAQDPRPIRIVLSSAGGSVSAGCAIYDAIRLCGVPVVIDGYGEVASIAVLIFQAGTLRRMTAETRFMVHDGSIALGETVEAGKLVRLSTEFQKINERYQSILSERSGLSFEEVKRACNQETYYSADQCIGLGFADSILTKLDWSDCLSNPKKWIKEKLTPKVVCLRWIKGVPMTVTIKDDDMPLKTKAKQKSNKAQRK